VGFLYNVKSKAEKAAKETARGSEDHSEHEFNKRVAGRIQKVLSDSS
jgi:hypothetical protein